jgi:hypothetical protein
MWRLHHRQVVRIPKERVALIFGADRNELRRAYAEAWHKHRAGRALNPLETQIAAIVGLHPEYESFVTGELDQDFMPEGGRTNPFLHMGLHLGLREQIATNRPAGIAAVFSALTEKIGDVHTTEHRMIDCLAEALWEAQRANRAPDEAKYLRHLRRLSA